MLLSIPFLNCQRQVLKLQLNENFMLLSSLGLFEQSLWLHHILTMLSPLYLLLPSEISLQRTFQIPSENVLLAWHLEKVYLPICQTLSFYLLTL